MKISYRNLKFVTHYQLNHPKEQMIDILQWPHIETGVIFVYILKVMDCDLEHVDRYKDQKAYSHFDSGFADTIFIYNPSSCRNKIFLYSKVQPSFTVSDKKNAVDIGTKRTIRDTYELVQLYGRY